MSDKISGWDYDLSPFHPGEQAIQTRLGIRDKMEGIGRRFIRPFIPDQHRAFYAQLPFILLGSVDAQDRPWASLVAGSPGFIQTPDATTLTIEARPLPGDPLHRNLKLQAPVGLLGIDLETRRRNRINGTIQAWPDPGLTIAVSQSFGNCPQYIQKRQLHWRSASPVAPPAESYTRLTPALAALITQSDTLFIASRYGTPAATANQGVDVSHRGGKPGFVRVENDHTFTIPDFTGNSFYNTLGNLVLNPQAGILLIDFAAGHLLSLTGRAAILWEGPEVDSFVGAQQLLRITIEEIVYMPQVLPFSWQLQDYSPSLAFTGQWPA